jgi:hypothetical protein
MEMSDKPTDDEVTNLLAQLITVVDIWVSEQDGRIPEYAAVEFERKVDGINVSLRVDFTEKANQCCS